MGHPVLRMSGQWMNMDTITNKSTMSLMDIDIIMLSISKEKQRAYLIRYTNIHVCRQNKESLSFCSHNTLVIECERWRRHSWKRLINNVSEVCFGLIQPATNFYIWFGKKQYQEDETGMLPLSFTLYGRITNDNKDIIFIQLPPVPSQLWLRMSLSNEDSWFSKAVYDSKILKINLKTCQNDFSR